MKLDYQRTYYKDKIFIVRKILNNGKYEYLYFEVIKKYKGVNTKENNFNSLKKDKKYWYLGWRKRTSIEKLEKGKLREWKLKKLSKDKERKIKILMGLNDNGEL